MSLTSEQRLVQYTLSGGSQTLAIPFKFFTAADIRVTRTRAGADTLLVYVTDYSLTGGGLPAATGSVTLTGTSGDIITLDGGAALTQANTLDSGGAPSYAVLTGMVDRVTILCQQLALKVARALRVPNTNAEQSEFALNARKNTMPYFDSAGDLDLLPILTSLPTDGSELLVTAAGATKLRTLADRAADAVSPEDYGAKGDGATDDTAAFAAAVASGRNVRCLGSSTYVTTSVINVTHDNQHIDGNGCTVTSLLDTQYEKFALTNRTNCKISNFTFQCLYTSASLAFAPGAISLYNSTGIVVDSCAINAVAGAGVYLFGACSDNAILNCAITNCFVGIFSDDDTVSHMPLRTKIMGCSIYSGLGTSSTTYSGGIKFSGIGSIASICNHIISGNSIVGAGQMGIEIQTMVNDVSIVGNTISGVGYGVSISGCNRITITGNTVKDCDTYGMEMASSANHVTISGNVITRADRSHTAINANTYSAHVAITGNEFLGWDTHVYLDLATYCTVDSNVCKLPGGADGKREIYANRFHLREYICWGLIHL